MFWKRASEWAKIAPNTPASIQFGLAACKGYSQLVIVPNDPTSQKFVSDVETIAEFASKSEISEKQYESAVSDLEAAVTTFARLQRRAIESSISEVYDGLRDVLKSLDGAIKSSEELETVTEDATTRLTCLQSAKSYEEVLTGIKKEISVLNYAVEKHREDAKLIRKVASQHVEVLRTKLKEAEKAVKTDHLTKLGNRGAFDLLITSAIAQVASGQEYCLAILDLDGFKSINDTFGHLAGDAALIEFSKKLHETFAQQGSSVARIGGDEFAVLCRGNIVQFEAKLERVNVVLSKTQVEYEGGKFGLRASYGCISLLKGHTPETAVQEADKAMYVNKRSKAA